MENGFYTTTDASRILRVHEITVAKWIDRGKLKAWKTKGGHRRITAATLKAYLRDHGVPVPPELREAGPGLRLLVVDAHPRTLRAVERSFKRLAATEKTNKRGFRGEGWRDPGRCGGVGSGGRR